MIVSCQRCGTSFQLDENRVPINGIRVRCSRCKQAFFLKHPSADETSAAHHIASDAVESGGEAVPPATSDLSSDDLSTSQYSAEPDPPPAAPPPQGDPSSDQLATTGAEFEEEEDWQFNEDSPNEAVEDVPHGELPWEDGDDDEPTPELDGGEDRESAFGSVDDYSELTEEDEEVAAAIAAQATPAAPQREPAPRKASGSDDLGEPEDWDFFSDESLETANVADASANIDPGLLRLWGELEEKIAIAPKQAQVFRPSEERGLREQLRHVGAVFGWIFTVVLLTAGVLQGLLSSVEAISQGPRAVVLGELMADRVEGRWLDTAHAGSVYVVSGRLVNRSPKESRVRGALRIALLDASGARINHPPQPAGLAISSRELRESLPADIRASQRRAQQGLRDSAISPGADLGFMVVFDDLPTEAMRFAIELVEAPRPAPLARTIGGSSVPSALLPDPATRSGGSEAEASAGRDAPSPGTPTEAVAR